MKKRKPVIPTMEPIGALVYVDGDREATIKQWFIVGTAFFKGPHYAVDFTSGEKGVMIAYDRVSAMKGKPK